MKRTALILLLACALVGVPAAVGADPPEQGYHSNPWLLGWIHATCCVTNDCCWNIEPEEIRLLMKSEYLEEQLKDPIADWYVILSTNQRVRRTGWSPDGKFYRCACDYDNVEKHWVKHQGAKTRCLFVPRPSAGRRKTYAHTVR